MSGRGTRGGGGAVRGGRRGRPGRGGSARGGRGGGAGGEAVLDAPVSGVGVRCVGACGRTFGEDSEQMLSCERCDGWVCRECAGVPEELYVLVSNRDDFPYFCEECKMLAITAVRTDADIEEKCNRYCREVTGRIDSLENNVATKAEKTVVDGLSARVSLLEQNLKNVYRDVSKAKENIVLARSEPEERAKRIKNVVIRGVCEGGELDDEGVVGQILNDIGCGTVVGQIAEVRRLGASGPTREGSGGETREGADGEQSVGSSGEVGGAAGGG